MQVIMVRPVKKLKDGEKHPIKKHGLSNTSEYRIWQGIKIRTRCEHSRDYQKYGARGIGMCDRWYDSVVHFMEDMGPRPSMKHTVGRINNDLGYFPENCRWETKKQQARNTRRNCLTWVDARTIRTTYKREVIEGTRDGLEVRKELAQRFGVDLGVVGQVVNDHIWA